MSRCGMIIAGYPGVGKSSYCDKHRDLSALDMESSHYNNAYNGDKWYEKYVSAAIYQATFGNTVFVSTHKEVLEELNKQAGESGIFCGLIYPSMGLEDWWIKRLQYRANLSGEEKDHKAYQRAYFYFESDIKDMTETHYENITKLIINKKEYRFEDAVDTFRIMADAHYETEEVKNKMDMNQIEEQLVRIINKLDNMEKANEVRDEKIDSIMDRLSSQEEVREKTPGRSRDDMECILYDIENIWADFPEMRLGQLIGNVVQDPKLYYIEDDKLVEVLQNYYNNIMRTLQ